MRTETRCRTGMNLETDYSIVVGPAHANTSSPLSRAADNATVAVAVCDLCSYQMNLPADPHSLKLQWRCNSRLAYTCPGPVPQRCTLPSEAK